MEVSPEVVKHLLHSLMIKVLCINQDRWNGWGSRQHVHPSIHCDQVIDEVPLVVVVTRHYLALECALDQ
jgi:hypothetical protein